MGPAAVPPPADPKPDIVIAEDVTHVVGCFAVVGDKPELIPNQPSSDRSASWLAALAARCFQQDLGRQ